MPRQEPAREFSAERRDRLRRSGVKLVDGQLGGDEALMSGPQLSGAGISQEDINAMFD